MLEFLKQLFSPRNHPARSRRRCFGRDKKPSRTTCVPRLELLESRTLPAVWTPIGPSPLHDPVGKIVPPGEDLAGRVSALAIASDYSSGTEKDVLYLGAAGGGVWMSTDFTGANPTWKPLSDNVLTAVDPTTGAGAGLIDVGSISVVPGVAAGVTTADKQGEVFVGTGEANYSVDSRYGSGILSAPTGQTFPVPDQANRFAFFRHSISKILIDPLNPKKMWAAVVSDGTGATNSASSDGLYYTIDGGQNWNRDAGAFRAFGGDNITDLDCSVDQASQNITIWAGVRDGGANNGVWGSKDDGSSWTQLGLSGGAGAGLPSGAGLDRVALAADHTPGSKTLYAAIALPNAPVSHLKNVYSSTDGGYSWKPLNPPFADQEQMYYNMAFGLDPANGRLYLAGNTKIVEWDPGTQKWLDITVDANGEKPHADAHVFAFQPDGTVYIGTDGGLWRYHPAAAGKVGTWDDLNTAGLQTIQMYAVAASPSNSSVLLASTQDNGLDGTTDGGLNWKYLTDGDSWAVRFDPTNGNIAYDLPSARGIAVSVDGGKTFVSIPLPQDKGKDIDYQAMALNPSNHRVVLMARDGVVYESVNAPGLMYNPDPAFEWSAISPRLDSSKISALSFAPANKPNSWLDMAYVAYSNGKLFRTVAGLQISYGTGPNDPIPPKWTDITGPWGANPITGIAVDPKSLGAAYVTIGAFDIGQVWYTPDFGATWFNISGDRAHDSLPNFPVDSIILDPNRRGVLYVGTDIGVFRGRPISGNTWVWDQLGGGLPAVQVSDLQIQNAANGPVLVVGTHGRGAWALNLNSVQALLIQEGSPSTVTLGSFTDPSGSGPANVTVAWGDGGEPAQGDFVYEPDGSIGVAWEDGSVSTSVLTFDSELNAWTLAIDHAWAEEGTYAVSAVVTMTDGTQVNVGDSNDPTILDVLDAPLTGAIANIQAVVGTPLVGVTVATFSDGNPNSSVEDFTASIDWGDGQQSDGTLQTATGGGFVVLGSHTYSNARSYTVHIVIADDGGAEADIDETATVIGPVTVTPPSPTEGIDPGLFTVATLNAPTADDYTAQITWGDGHVTYGTLTPNGDNSYLIQDDHTYAEDGSYTLAVAVTEGDSFIGSASDTVVVADAALTAAAQPLNAAVGQPLTGVTVATFADANPSAPVGDFTAVIDWGDGTAADGTVQAAAGGGFTVAGSHTYATAGDFPLTVTVYDEGGSTAQASANVTASYAPGTVVPLQIFGTGVDDNGNPLPAGAVDPHYALVAAPAPDAAGPVSVTINDGFPFAGYWTADGAASNWISPNADENDFAGGVTEPVGDYTYETTFDLTGLDPSTARITGHFAADNSLVGVLLNGQPAGYTLGGNGYASMNTLTITSGFAPGVNTLDFVVRNDPQSDPSDNAHNPSGFQAELSGTALAATPPAAGQVRDGSFEYPDVSASNPDGNTGYWYDPTGSAWSFSGSAGVEANGSAWGAAAAPDGVQAAFLQGAGSISQDVLLNPGTYVIAFQAARRAGWGGPNPVQFSMDGQNVGAALTPTSGAWAGYVTAQFTVVSAGMHTIGLAGTNSNGDNTTFLDAVMIVAIAPTNGIRDGSFETVSVAGLNPDGATGYWYDPTGSAWQFTGQSGIESNGSAWGAAAAPDGVQAAFLQDGGAISQTLLLDSGTYVVAFQAAQRTNWGGPNPVQFSVDGQDVGVVVTPAGSAWTGYVTVQFTIASSGPHTLSFAGTNLDGDNTSFLDDVTLTEVALDSGS